MPRAGTEHVGPAVLPLHIALFGQPRIVAADDSREFVLPRKTLNVLAFLVLNRHRPVSRDSVAFTLFPDDEEDTARASLRRNLSYLHSSLPTLESERRFVLADAERLAWNEKAPSRVDVVDFERAVAEGRDDDAIAAYGGDLLATLYDEWTIPIRERMRNLYHVALSRTVARERERRRFDAATLAARRLLDEDPWREDILRALMTVRFEAGDRAGALAAFERFEQRLRDELHAAPMTETVALREAILEGRRPATSERERIRLAARPQPNAPEPALPFVGRDEPWARVQEMWRAVADGDVRALCVAGEAGVGKSRFVTEVARLVEREGAFVVRAETTAGGEGRPYEAIVEALTAPVRSRRSARVADVWQRDIERLVDDTALPREAGDAFERRRLFEAVRLAILESAKARPFVLVLEDLHWARAATIDLLDYVLARLGGAPVFVVMTMRTDELSRGHPLRNLAATLGRREFGGEIVLERLPSRVMERAARTAAPSLADDDIARALARADGVPLVLVETLRDLVAGRPIEASGIDELVGERFARLDPRAETALAFAAVIGARFDATTLSAAMGWRNDEVVEALGASVELGLVRAAAGRERGIAFAFTHHLVHSAAYLRVARDERVQAHGLVARVLDALPEAGGMRAAEVARQYASSGNAERAMRRYLDAARYALGIHANADAAEFAAMGLALARGTSDASRRVRFELLAARERALELIGATGGQRAAALELGALAETLDRDEFRCRAAERVFNAHANDEAVRAQALAALRRLAPRSPNAEAIALQLEGWEAYVAAGDHRRARAAYAAAADAFERLGDTASALRARLQEIEILVHGRLCAIDEVRSAVEALRVRIERHDDLPLRAAFYRKAAVAIGQSDYRAALADARRALDIAAGIGDRTGEADAREDAAFFLTRLGEFESGLAEFARALEAFRDADEPYGEARTLLSIASVRCSCGDYAPVRGLIDAIAPAMRTRPFLEWRIDATRAELALRTGELDEAQALLLRGLERVGALGTPLPAAQLLHALAIVSALRGDAASARSRLDTALEALEVLDHPAQFARALARSALLYALAGDARAARAEAERSAAVASGTSIEHYGQFAWLHAAAYALLKEDDRARSFAAAAAAAFTANALRMDAHLAECYARLPWHVRAVGYLSGREVPLGF